jgi:hypothetical protein
MRDYLTHRRAIMPTEPKLPTFDQKLKALEIACTLIPLGNAPGSTQQGFDKYMDEYFSTVKGVATLVLRTASWVET